jgi:predicted TPR repeat methyltransferase
MKYTTKRNVSSHNISNGHQHLRAGQLEDALKSYRLARDESPDDPAAHSGIGFVLESQGRFREALLTYQSALKVLPETAPMYFRLGCTLQALGRLEASYEAFKETVRIDPVHASAHNNMGIVAKMTGNPTQARTHFERAIQIYFAFGKARDNLARLLTDMGQKDEAIRLYEASIAMQLPDSRASHLLAALRNNTPASIPAEQIRQLFDDCASTFEQHLVGTLEYDGPNILHSILMNVIAGGDPQCELPFDSALDLGCGTGLMGLKMKEIAKAIDGVDLAPNMITQAKRKSLYRELTVGDCVDFLKDLPKGSRPYNLIVAADVFTYLGDLREMFVEVSANLAARGLFGFSVENIESQHYTLQPTGRYAHSQTYVHHLAGETGFRVAASQRAPLRIEQGAPINGTFYVLTADE